MGNHPDSAVHATREQLWKYRLLLPISLILTLCTILEGRGGWGPIGIGLCMIPATQPSGEMHNTSTLKLVALGVVNLLPIVLTLLTLTRAFATQLLLRIAVASLFFLLCAAVYIWILFLVTLIDGQNQIWLSWVFRDTRGDRLAFHPCPRHSRHQRPLMETPPSNPRRVILCQILVPD